MAANSKVLSPLSDSSWAVNICSTLWWTLWSSHPSPPAAETSPSLTWLGNQGCEEVTAPTHSTTWLRSLRNFTELTSPGLVHGPSPCGVTWISTSPQISALPATVSWQDKFCSSQSYSRIESCSSPGKPVSVA